jgi:hypothetical protein
MKAVEYVDSARNFERLDITFNDTNIPYHFLTEYVDLNNQLLTVYIKDYDLCQKYFFNTTLDLNQVFDEI